MSTILVMDDDPGIREVYGRHVKEFQAAIGTSADVVHASGWDEGERIISVRPIAGILADLTMPPHNADMTLTKVSEVARTWGPIVIITGNPDIEYQRRAILICGAEDYVRKDEPNAGWRAAVALQHAIWRRMYRA